MGRWEKGGGSWGEETAGIPGSGPLQEGQIQMGALERTRFQEVETQVQHAGHYARKKSEEAAPSMPV